MKKFFHWLLNIIDQIRIYNALIVIGSTFINPLLGFIFLLWQAYNLLKKFDEIEQTKETYNTLTADFINMVLISVLYIITLSKIYSIADIDGYDKMIQNGNMTIHAKQQILASIACKIILLTDLQFIGTGLILLGIFMYLNETRKQE
jgi:hypothetical protein